MYRSGTDSCASLALGNCGGTQYLWPQSVPKSRQHHYRGGDTL